jgi:hypothetical protein
MEKEGLTDQDVSYGVPHLPQILISNVKKTLESSTLIPLFWVRKANMDVYQF